MASLTIRKLDDDTKERLRVRAAQNGRSMAEEARVILRATVACPSGADLVLRSRALFDGDDGIDLDLPKRSDGQP